MVQDSHHAGGVDDLQDVLTQHVLVFKINNWDAWSPGHLKIASQTALSTQRLGVA